MVEMTVSDNPVEFGVDYRLIFLGSAVNYRVVFLGSAVDYRVVFLGSAVDYRVVFLGSAVDYRLIFLCRHLFPFQNLDMVLCLLRILILTNP